MSLAPFYPIIYKSRFTSNQFIRTDLGWIGNDQNIYLCLQDLDMLHDLGNILDFFRRIDKEGSSFRIKLPCKYVKNCCYDSIRKKFCISCSMYLCEDCKVEHINCFTENLEIKCNYDTSYGHCIKCNLWTDQPLANNMCNNCVEPSLPCQYNKPLINFNLYEWIPIGDFLENRNPFSSWYSRKIRLIYHTNYIEFKLIHYNVDYYLDTKSTLHADACFHVFEYFNVPTPLDTKIMNLMGRYSYSRQDKPDLPTTFFA